MLILQNNRFDDLMLGLARTFGKTRRTAVLFIRINIRDKIDFLTIRYLGASKRYSEAVVANGLVFLSGMVPENPEADAKAQTENVLAQIDSWLAQCQSDKAHILEATIYLPDMNDYAAMNEAWDAWTAPERAPARACVEAKLASPDWKVEIKITALQIK